MRIRHKMSIPLKKQRRCVQMCKLKVHQHGQQIIYQTEKQELERAIPNLHVCTHRPFFILMSVPTVTIFALSELQQLLLICAGEIVQQFLVG